MKICLPLIAFAAVISFSLPSKVYALRQFTTAIASTYTVHSDGITLVDHRVTLTNQTDNVYAREYNLTLATDQADKITARDSQGNILKTIKKQNGLTYIILVFNDKVVGKQQTLSFRVSYQTDKLAKKQGRIWQVTIPALPESNNLESYRAVLKIPADFPSAAWFKPYPQRVAERQYFWSKAQLQRAGAIGYFGRSQYYSIKLSYHLANDSLKPARQMLALPPATAYQQVILAEINPQPANIAADADGNWLAIYNLAAKTKLTITAKLGVETFIRPKDKARLTLSKQEQLRLLRAQPFWEADNPKIKNLAADLADARAIYRYVTKNLSYNYKKIEENNARLGAVKSLARPTYAVCTEFTDLFIALARASGIPAREINGFAYAENPDLQPLSLVADLLHAWPEYYDRQQQIWRPLDPTWGNTTGGIDYFNLFDFDHIVFAIHGASSTFPLSAGFYKQGVKQAFKDIKVNFADKLPAISNKPLILRLVFPAEISGQTAINGTLFIKNPNNVAVYNVKPIVSSNPLRVRNKIKPIPVLPPFAIYKIPLTIAAYNRLTPLANKIQAFYNGVNTHTTVEIIPLEIKYLPFFAGVLSAILILITILWLTKNKL